jgi:hypothetical protein
MATAILSLTSAIIGQRFVYEEDGLLVLAQSLFWVGVAAVIIGGGEVGVANGTANFFWRIRPLAF